jgi:hypothetical protein
MKGKMSRRVQPTSQLLDLKMIVGKFISPDRPSEVIESNTPLLEPRFFFKLSHFSQI